jgi:uncharacterized protein YyaL (SSP411 family)
LEDYANVVEAFIQLYQLTAELKWLETAKLLTEKVEKEFQHEESKMCFFTTKNSELISRKMELNDNVLPASNSIMANNFLFMGHYFRNENWIANAEQMLANVYDEMEQYGSGYSNWGLLLLRQLKGIIEIVTIESTSETQQAVASQLSPFTLATFHLEIPNAENHENDGIYVCKKGICYPPVPTIIEMSKLL